MFQLKRLCKKPLPSIHIQHFGNYVSAQSGLCPFGNVSIRDRVHSGSCSFGMVPIWDCVHSDGVYSKWCPFEIVFIRDCAIRDCVHS